ncbi:MAG: glycosyltransferase [Roseiflexus sp.]|nr:glycosyltransferase [Roseiflexus sp.]MCS7290527.1 glycosyltransferase [Roseiflexus sp.]MDW8148332.1 glycosyltransferase [Roseiflexaceae bacterium]MDW8232362.1 glycosyltransferase [Roseiflexaceae bacterium]
MSDVPQREPATGSVPRILFAISDTGGGHRSGAQAIAAAIAQRVGDAVETYIIDIFTHTGVPVVRNAPVVYDKLSTRWLPLYDTLYRLTDGRRRIDALTKVVYFAAHRNILRVLEAVRPTLVVSVHPLLNRLIGNARRTYRLSFRFITVVTDLVSLHASWADPDAELCIVPTNEAYERMRRLGMPESKLIRTGFPVHPKFAAYHQTRDAARANLGLVPELFTVLVTSGGVGSGHMEHLVRNIHTAYPQLQLLVVTGRNTALRERLEKGGFGPNVHIFGFVTNMEELMAASDIVISKAGPGTLMEALVMRRPVIVTQAVGMQERGNIDFVLNHELGLFCPSIDRIVPVLAELMEPSTYAAVTARLVDAVPRDGAAQIASILLEQLHLAPPVRRRRRLRLPSVRLPRPRALVRRLRLPRLRGLGRWRRPPSGRQL